MTRDHLLSELRQLKPQLNQRYGLKRMALFGSYSQNKAKSDSDIDLVVELAEWDLFTLVHLKEELEKDLEKPVDLIPFSDSMNQFLKMRILRESVDI